MRTGTVAEFLKVSDETIRNWADGILNCIQDGKNQRLFSRSEVKNLQ
jgi:excisionase family DNA binding protein